jgi:dimethylaniline monooxygenase (N-oxide forming)
VEFDSGTVLDDAEAVFCATFYITNVEVALFHEQFLPIDCSGQELVRLRMNIFRPKYADLVALLCHSAYGKNNGSSFADV